VIRLFASDLDGTLLNYLHQTDPIILRAVRSVTDTGRHFVVSTGRFMTSNHDFGFDGLPIEAVCANGALIYDAHGRLLRHKLLDRAFLEELLLTFPHVNFDCVGTRHMYTRMTREVRDAAMHAEGFLGVLARRAMVRNEQRVWVYEQSVDQILEQDIVKVTTRLSDPDLRRQLDTFLFDWRETVVNAPFAPELYEITNREVNKGEAVAWLASHLGVAQDEVAVYGDGGNDTAMLERFAPYGHAYTPHRADPRAKAAANKVLGSNVLYAVPRHMLRTIRG
jgi:Cof subfamily protein (haloacid dehalogenase superfamily)